MRFQIVEPTGFLKNYIKHYCFMESDRSEGDVTERVIPTENVQLMFHYKNPFVVMNPDGSTVNQPRSIISGLSNSFSDVSTLGDSGVVFVTFHPNGACHFFDFPLSEIQNRSVDLSNIFYEQISEVEELLFLKSSMVERVGVIENFLLKRFAPIPAHDSVILQKGIEVIKNLKGQATALSLSNYLSVSPKSLERKFSYYLGKTPKQIIKLIRFQTVVSDLSGIIDMNLTEYAYLNGYFDQAHFIKDFKALSGYTPKEFRNKYCDSNANAYLS